MHNGGKYCARYVNFASSFRARNSVTVENVNLAREKERSISDRKREREKERRGGEVSRGDLPNGISLFALRTAIWMALSFGQNHEIEKKLFRVDH